MAIKKRQQMFLCMLILLIDYALCRDTLLLRIGSQMGTDENR